jgi:hypothetical protein
MVMAAMMSTLLAEAHSLENPVAKRSAGETIDKSAPTRTCCSPRARDGSSHGKKKITCPLPRHGSIMPYDVTKSDHFTHCTLAVGFVFDFFSSLFSNFFGGERGFFLHSLFSYEKKYPASIILGSTLPSPEFILFSYFRTSLSIPSSILAIILLSILIFLDSETW